MRSKKAIAVIGLGAVLPDANNVNSFWNNLLSARYSITDIPQDRWDVALYYSPDRSDQNKTYTKIGAFVRDYTFEALKLGIAIPPRVLDQMDLIQKWSLDATHQALTDYGWPKKAIDGDRVAVILGNSNAGEFHYRSTFRILLPEYLKSLAHQAAFKALPAEVQQSLLDGIRQDIYAQIPAITEDTMPGELSNIIAGRIANVFNFNGPNYISDAACASSLAALQGAIDALQDDRADLVVTGGVDRSMGIESYLKFCRIGALSAVGSMPYADGADGFVMGEGAVVYLLKRLEDAERDGDKIYALVRGIGSSSDGKGKGITAPNPAGQQKAIERALKDAGISPVEIGLLEGHGTSTKVGDVVELNSLQSVFGPYNLKSGSIALGSVKSNIGHLKSASGAAGLLKVILGLNHQVLPPTANFSKPNPAIDFSRSAFAPALRADEWRVENGKNRFAGVSSFGFGGTNFHVILEAYAPELSGTLKGAVAVPLQISDLPVVNIPEATESVAYESNEEVKAYVLQAVSEKTGYPVEMLDLELDLEADLGIDTVKQAELFAQVREHFSIARQDDLQLADYNTLEKVIAFATGFGTNNSGSSTIKAPGTNQNVDLEVLPATDNGFTRHKPNKAPLNGLYFASAQNLTALLDKLSTDLENIHRGNVPQSRLPEISAIEQPERLAIDYADPAELAKRLQKAIDILGKPEPNLTALQAHGIYKGHGTPGKVTFMFPGQGSQYVNMLKDLREHEAIIDQTFIEADQALLSTLGKPLTEYIYANGDPEQVAQAEAELKNTSITQPAILTVNVALLRLLQQYGFEPDFVVGHSLGEYAALVASGVMDFGSALKVVAARGREMSSLQLEDKGCMAAVQAPLAEVETIIKACSDYVVIANANSPMQSVLGGTTAGVDEAIQRFTDAGYQAVKIPVSHAFHTKIIAPASVPLRKTIESMTINAPQIPIIANVDAEIYPHGREEIIDLLSRQVASPVQFVRSMQKLYELGSRVFVEVGPKRVLNALANDNLKDKAGIITLATNHPRKNSVVSFNEAICGMLAAGIKPMREEASTKDIPELVLDATSAPVVQSSEAEVRLSGSVVISGVGLGLPGKSHKVFEDDNVASILKGDMRIDALPTNRRKDILNHNVVRLEKSNGSAEMQKITDLEQTISFAGQRGSFDLTEEFGISTERVESYDLSTQLAIAAGLEALRDAGIPLVMAYRQTSTGSFLPNGWKLPQSMQEETGVIFASAFPGLNNMAKETQRYYRSQALTEKIQTLENLLAELSIDDQKLRSKLEAELAKHRQELKDLDYTFDRRFIFQILSMGHSQFAELIGARGPNTSVNAACATTTQAIGLAEDWIRTGRARRVIVVAGDEVTDENLAGWIGTGLFASGAASTQSDLRQAVLPFDKRRNGMIMGMGAAALVVEAMDGAVERGIEPIAEILASQITNSAFHGTRIDIEHVSHVMDTLLNTVENRFGLKRDAIADKTMFMSHETYTPARGGSASAEIYALRQVFGAQANKVIIANTKGFTGHTMGVGVEDVVAVKALETGIVPPIAHIDEDFQPDPDLGDLNLSKGGTYKPNFALRLGAGFGSQLAMLFLGKVAQTSQRVQPQVHDQWLAAVSGYAKPEIEVVKRTLRIQDKGVPESPRKESDWHFGMLPRLWAKAVKQEQPVVEPLIEEKVQPTAVPMEVATPALRLESNVVADAEVEAFVLALVAEKTGYPVEMLDPDLDLEADLGIDTVKQAELFATIREHYQIPRQEDLQLASYNTLKKVFAFVHENTSAGVESPVVKEVLQDELVSSSQSEVDNKAINDYVLAAVAEKTGYPVEMLDPDLDLEADLGIDTVKQAELFAQVREQFDIPRQEDLQLASYNTLRKVVGFVEEALKAVPEQKLEEPEPTETPMVETLQQEEMAQPHVIRLRSVQPRLITRLDLTESTGQTLDKGKVLILNGKHKAASKLASVLKGRDVEVKQLNQNVLDDATQEWLKSPDFQGVFNLYGLDEDPAIAAAEHQEWQDELSQRLETLLTVAQSMPAKAFLISATRMGGQHGFFKAQNPSGGAYGGFTKAFGLERRVLAKVVDFESKASNAFIADTLVEETLHDPASIEVGREKGLRFSYGLKDFEHEASQHSFEEGSVFVISGATGGIAEPILMDLASRVRGKFVLLSRTQLQDLDQQTLALLQNDKASLRLEMMQSLSQKMAKKPTPVEVEKEIAKLEKSAAIHQLMAAITKKGSQASYISCDVADLASVEKAMTEIAKLTDRIDYLVHAAGFEKSQRLENKTPDELKLTFAPKVRGLFNLLHASQASQRLPKGVVMFSSIAGRFGNAGQVDYSAANDMLAKLSYALPSQFTDTHFVSLDWGPWAEVGMASRGSIPQLMERAGIQTLPPNEAAPVVGDMLLAGVQGEVLVAGDLGMMARNRYKNHAVNIELADRSLREGRPEHTMFSHLSAFNPFQEGITFEAKLDPAQLEWLRDHAIRGIPVLPGVAGIEGFTRAAKHIANTLSSVKGKLNLDKLEDIHFLAPFKFYGGKSRTTTWHANTYRSVRGIEMDVRLLSFNPRIPSEDKSILHFTGRVILKEGKPERISKQTAPVHVTETLDAQEIYRLFFHGPAFQILSGAGVNEEGVVATLNTALLHNLAEENTYLVTPMLIESCFQTVGLYEAGLSGRIALPASVGAVTVYENTINRLPLYSEITPQIRGDEVGYSARVVDAEGNLYVEIDDYRTVKQAVDAEESVLAPIRNMVNEKRS